MSEPIKHTPGPWTTDGCYIDSSDVEIAMAQGGHEEGVMEANARLIAAAPDLLGALYHAREAILWHNAGDFCLNGSETVSEVIKKAIAKAEGGS